MCIAIINNYYYYYYYYYYTLGIKDPEGFGNRKFRH